MINEILAVAAGVLLADILKQLVKRIPPYNKIPLISLDKRCLEK